MNTPDRPTADNKWGRILFLFLAGCIERPRIIKNQPVPIFPISSTAPSTSNSLMNPRALPFASSVKCRQGDDGLLDLGVDPAWPTYFRGMELSQSSKRVGPIRALLPGVSD